MTTRNVTPWTAAEVALLRSYVQQGLGYDQIVKRFEQDGIRRTYKAVQRKAQQERNKAPDQWHARMPRSDVKRYDEPLEVTGNAVILGDIHCPFHDARWMDKVIGLALKRGINQAIIAGDLADFNAFSTFGRDVGIDADAEIDALSDLVDALGQCFERIHYFAGNHDVRPIRALRDAGLSMHTVMRMFAPRPDDKTFYTSDYHWCWLTSGGVRYQIEHPKNASIHATLVPKKLAAKYECSVIAAHGHVWGITRSDSGRHWAIDSGMMADPQRMGYCQIVHNVRPMMMQGAVLVIDGLPLLVSPETIGMY